MKSIFLLSFAAAVITLTSTTTTQARSPGHFNKRGNILIADQLNNRVIEVNPANGAIVWQFGDGGTNAGPTTIFAPHDAERVGSLTYIACTGAPAGSQPGCPAGCPDNRVIAVSKNGRIIWQYGQAGVTGSGTNQLNSPVSVRVLPKRHILITDQGNQRVIELASNNALIWQYGTTGVSGSASNQLNNPASAERRNNKDTVIADQGNNRVIEVTHRDLITTQLDTLTDASSLNGPAYAGHLRALTIIADSLNNRIVVVDPVGSNAFEYVTNTRPGSVANPNPTRAVRLKKGNTLISDQFNHQVIEIDPPNSRLHLRNHRRRRQRHQRTQRPMRCQSRQRLHRPDLAQGRRRRYRFPYRFRFLSVCLRTANKTDRWQALACDRERRPYAEK